MRKICFSLVVLSMILLMVSLSFAQGSRGATKSEGKTSFTDIAVVGLARDGTDGLVDTGVPGYIEMTNTAGNVYYFYVGYDGKLRISTEVVVGWLASPAIVGWSDASGTIVGAQAYP